MFGTAPIIPDAPIPATALFLPVYNGPEEDGLIGFVQEYDSGFKAFDNGKVLLGDAFTSCPAAADAIWADCLGVKSRSNGGAVGEEPDLEPEPAQEDEVSAEVDPATPEVTLFTNARGALTKQFTLDTGGNLVKTEGGQMAAGTAMRIAIGDVQALAELVGTASSDQALALGSMRADLPVQVTVTTKKVLNGRTAPDVISRSREYMTFGEWRGFCLGDFDRKGITAEVQGKLEQRGGFVAALGMVIPELKNTGYVVRASTSAGLFRTDTGQRFTDSGGIHLYLGIKDVSELRTVLEDLARSVLAR